MNLGFLIPEMGKISVLLHCFFPHLAGREIHVFANDKLLTMYMG